MEFGGGGGGGGDGGGGGAHFSTQAAMNFSVWAPDGRQLRPGGRGAHPAAAVGGRAGLGGKAHTRPGLVQNWPVPSRQDALNSAESCSTASSVAIAPPVPGGDR
eukprot:SAG11_NODE_777_length_7218_cov_24.269420_2_plen_104_part_00